ncbi:PSP1 C-terminal conserved region-domain-containing protein [Chytriomyces cf. hyalinus JEL632]|nr:PSP1 C-terminal conserved region-domain-containing protein [Chytriomyces cf. hyalinus JEL632]
MDALYDPSKGEATPIFEGIDDYFENTEHRTKAWVEAGKNLSKQNTYTQQYYWPVYVIEFKAGRIDYFHAGETVIPGQMIRAGDLVIVEADRGKDLGKVIHDNLANLAQLHLFQSQHKDIMVESLISSKEIQPKRIYGLAQQGEVSLLVSKAQDEAKAMAVCQAKIRQRKLPMEIVDAEYQWDRKKLTFYFVADRRVDFRELIRDLFKLYKTRIWMCAVDPTKMPRPF